MTPNNLDLATLQQRYNLLCRALQATPAADDPQPALDKVSRLDDLIHRELLELARLGSPDDFADIYLGFARELAHFREFCADPRLAEKTIVPFGGPFSAGKSSLINALIGKKLLVVEVDPTTALPAYVLAGEADAVHALNLHRLRVPLSDDEFASLTHDETHRYGSQVSRALSAAFVTRRDFPWVNLAIIDTPGYTGRATAGDRTDADVANAQLAGAHAIVWVASVKQGNLSEEDLAFIARLDPAIPRIVVASHADQLTESDRSAVVERMRETLAARNLPVLGVHAVSARPRQAELLAPLRAQLDAWNQVPRLQRFAYRFKALFTRYQRGLEREAAAARWQLHRINRIATLADGDLASDAGELKTVVGERLDALKTVESRLRELRGRFFAELKCVGDAVGILLPEPYEEELQDPEDSNLLDLLVALREQEGREEPNFQMALIRLRKLKTVATDKQNPLDVLCRVSTNNALEGDFLTERHSVSMATEHFRHHYALLLAAVLKSLPIINARQNLLFLVLLDAIGLGGIRDSLYYTTRTLPMATLQDAARQIKESLHSRDLMLDILLLISLGQPISDETECLTVEFGAMIGISADELRDCAVQAAIAQQWLTQDMSSNGDFFNNFSGLENPFWNALLKWLRNHLVPTITSAAEHGDALAQVRLGIIFLIGLYGVEQDPGRALNWFNKAAKKKSSSAQLWLGRIYRDGSGVAQDFEAARSWLRKAAKQKSSTAQFELAELYEKGLGALASVDEALILYSESAEQGNFRAQIKMFWVYMNGDLGASKNQAQALVVLRNAAEQGNPEAQNCLSLAYNGGRWGVQVDQAMAFDWGFKSAENGFVPAKFNVGCHYCWGLGVRKDEDKGIAWITKAAKQGMKEAQEFLGNLEKKEKEDNEILRLKREQSRSLQELKRELENRGLKEKTAYETDGYGMKKFFEERKSQRDEVKFERESHIQLITPPKKKIFGIW